MVLEREHKRAVGIFPTLHAATPALNELQDAGFPMERVSVIAKDSQEAAELNSAGKRDSDDNKADLGATKGAIAGGAVGGLTGLLVGLGAVAIPGLGPVMLAGAAATALATTLSGTAIGAAAGSLIGGLVGLGIPEERAKVYSERVASGAYLLIIDGTEEEIKTAEAIVKNHGIEEWGIYEAPSRSAIAH